MTTKQDPIHEYILNQFVPLPLESSEEARVAKVKAGFKVAKVEELREELLNRGFREVILK